MSVWTYTRQARRWLWWARQGGGSGHSGDHVEVGLMRGDQVVQSLTCEGRNHNEVGLYRKE